MRQKMGLIIILNLFFVLTLMGQSQPTLEEILDESEKQTANYQETFRNLLALETKIFEEYDKKSKPKKQNIVEANFLVYQSSKNNKLSFELRNVIKVDGKSVPNSQTNADQFFAELSKTTTLKSELEKVNKKSSKYDKTLDISGLTLYEGIVLAKNLRPYFEYQLVSKESYQGRDVFIINYWQTKESLFISINGKGAELNNPSLEFEIDMPGDLKKKEFFLRGKFWIDAITFQIWREERELVAQANELITLLKTDFEYQTSSYGILVPKQINLLTNKIKKKNGKFIIGKDLMISFNYSKFRKTETDVKILDDTQN